MFCDTVDMSFLGPGAQITKGSGRKRAAAMERLLAGESANGTAPIDPTRRRVEMKADDV